MQRRMGMFCLSLRPQAGSCLRYKAQRHRGYLARGLWITVVSVGFDRLAVLISWSSEEACVSTSSAKGLWLEAALSACR